MGERDRPGAITEMAMTEIAEAPGRSEGLDEFGGDVLAAPVTARARRAAILSQGRTEVSTTMRAQLAYVANMRQFGYRFLINYSTENVDSLLWRLIAAVAIAAGVAACGLLLCGLALLGTPVRPNPYVALAVLLVGVTLCATVATAVHGERPRILRR